MILSCAVLFTLRSTATGPPRTSTGHITTMGSLVRIHIIQATTTLLEVAVTAARGEWVILGGSVKDWVEEEPFVMMGTSPQGRREGYRQWGVSVRLCASHHKHRRNNLEQQVAVQRGPGPDLSSEAGRHKTLRESL